MRHLFIRGSYKPLGVSGEALVDALMTLRPEIYGSIADSERVELNGLLYVFERLPQGIEECRFVKLISREGYENSSFEPVIAGKRRRNCYQVDDSQMFIEVTRGRSDIYDILTHLTFMYVEAEKIRKNSQDNKGRTRREWEKLAQIIELDKQGETYNKEVAYTYLSTILGRTFEETVAASERFEDSKYVKTLFHIVYWLGKISRDEAEHNKDREVSFSSALREKVGHHIYGEQWASNIKKELYERGLIERPLHIISANLHSVMNCLFAPSIMLDYIQSQDIIDIAEQLSIEKNAAHRKRVKKFAQNNGMFEIEDTSGTSLSVQIFDSHDFGEFVPEFVQKHVKKIKQEADKPLILVMDLVNKLLKLWMNY
jgi:hypothetical protein